jgi:hypothetical protein
MMNDEFQNRFDEVLHGAPDYAKSSITEYIATGIKCEILISDEAADKAQKVKKIDIPAAHLLATDTNWHFVFRPFLLDAPGDILRSIIRHEIIHGFLISVECLPTQAAQAEVNKYKQRLGDLQKKFKIELPEGYDMTEDLVCTINDDWGGDDLAAKKWLQKKLKKQNIGI